MDAQPAALLARLRTGELTAEDAVARQLELLRAPAVTHGVAALADARALADAAALDRAFATGGPVGPLHGLPVTVKDWIDVEGFPYAGTTADTDRRPAHDPTVIARLRAAGAVVVAKTRPWGGVTHPRDPARTVGGSSSGEAALIAAGASVLGLGSDSGGSIRLPAAWAGVCGLRPTAGRVPTTGHYPRVGPRSDGRTDRPARTHGGRPGACPGGDRRAGRAGHGRRAGAAAAGRRGGPARSRRGRGRPVANPPQAWRPRCSGPWTRSSTPAPSRCRGSSTGSRPRGTSAADTGRARAASPG